MIEKGECGPRLELRARPLVQEIHILLATVLEFAADTDQPRLPRVKNSNHHGWNMKPVTLRQLNCRTSVACPAEIVYKIYPLGTGHGID